MALLLVYHLPATSAGRKAVREFCDQLFGFFLVLNLFQLYGKVRAGGHLAPRSRAGYRGLPE